MHNARNLTIELSGFPARLNFLILDYVDALSCNCLYLGGLFPGCRRGHRQSASFGQRRCKQDALGLCETCSPGTAQGETFPVAAQPNRCLYPCEARKRKTETLA